MTLHEGAKPWGPPASVSSPLDVGPGHDGLFMEIWLLLGLLSDRLRKEAVGLAPERFLFGGSPGVGCSSRSCVWTFIFF